MTVGGIQRIREVIVKYRNKSGYLSWSARIMRCRKKIISGRPFLTSCFSLRGRLLLVLLGFSWGSVRITHWLIVFVIIADLYALPLKGTIKDQVQLRTETHLKPVQLGGVALAGALTAVKQEVVRDRTGSKEPEVRKQTPLRLYGKQTMH